MERRPARSAAKNTRRNKLKGDVHYIDTTYLAVLSYTFILILLLFLLLLLSWGRLKESFLLPTEAKSESQSKSWFSKRWLKVCVYVCMYVCDEWRVFIWNGNGKWGRETREVNNLSIFRIVGIYFFLG